MKPGNSQHSEQLSIISIARLAHFLEDVLHLENVALLQQKVLRSIPNAWEHDNMNHDETEGFSTSDRIEPKNVEEADVTSC